MLAQVAQLPGQELQPPWWLRV